MLRHRCFAQGAAVGSCPPLSPLPPSCESSNKQLQSSGSAGCDLCLENKRKTNSIIFYSFCHGSVTPHCSNRSARLDVKGKPRAGKKKNPCFLILLNFKYSKLLQIIKSKFKRDCEKWGNEHLCYVDLSGKNKQRSESRSRSNFSGALGWCRDVFVLHGKEQRGAGVRGQTPASAAGASDVNLGDGEGNIDSRMVLSALNDRPYVCKIV